MSSRTSLLQRIAAALVFSMLFACGLPTEAAHNDSSEGRLERGEVVTELRKIDGINFVSGKILIDQPPSHVWPIMTNPFEFEGKISPRMKSVNVLVDRADFSLLKCTIAVGFCIPAITYVVESKYDPLNHIEFKRVGGDLRDFKGLWEVKPLSNGRRCELTYSMYIDPGIPVPQWLIREGVKMELPRTLVALRQRIRDIYTASATPEARSILAASTVAKTSSLKVEQNIP